MAEIDQVAAGDGIPATLQAEDDLPIHQDYADEEEQKNLVSVVQQVFQKYKDWKSRYIEEIWVAAHMIYNGHVPMDNSPYIADYANREVFRQMESLKPLLASLILPDDGQWFTYKPRHGNGDEAALAATALVEYHLEHNNLRQEVVKWLDNAPMWGVSYLRYGWKKFKEVKRKISRIRGKSKEENIWKRESAEVLYDAPHLEWLDHWRVYCDPYIEDPRESPMVIVDQVVSGAYLKTQARAGQYDVAAVKKVITERMHAKNNEHTAIHPQNDAKDFYDILPNDEEFAERTVYTNDGWVFVILADMVVARASLNPFGKAPILTLRNYPQPNCHYGQGEPEVLLGDHRLLHDAISMWIDSYHIGYMPMLKAPATEKNNMRLVQFGPGEVAYFDDPERVTSFETGTKTFELGSVIGVILQNMQLATGLTNEVTGTGSKQSTATGIVRLQNAASARIEHKVRWYLPAFKELYRVLYNLEAEYFDEELVLRITGTDGKKIDASINPSDFEADVDVIVQAAPTNEGKQQDMNNFQVLYQMLGMDPRINLEPILLKGMRAFGITDPKRVLASSVQTQQDALKAIADFMATGFIDPAMPQDDHNLWVQQLGMFTQTQQFLSLDPFYQALLQARLAQHLKYLGIMDQQGQNVAQESPYAEQAPGQDMAEESMGNVETGSRMAGANEQGAGMEAIAAGNF